MTFEGFDAAPLIEGAGFSPLLAGGAMILVAGADGALEAALQAAGPGPRAAPDPHDLWAGADRGDIFERGWHGRAAPADPDRAAAHGTRDLVPHAIFADDVDGDGEEDGPITVTGRRNVSEGTDGDIGGNYGAGFYPGTSGPGGSSVDGQTEQAKDTPCVEAAPSNVALQDLNNQVLKASNDIHAGNDEMWEYGVIFYLKDGRLQNTGIFGGDSPREINWNLGFARVPDGAIIVATLHNHPDDPNVDDRIPSMDTMQNPGGNDWPAYDNFLSVADRNSRGITTDPNLLMYIFTNEDSKTRVYDKTDHNTTHPSCTLQPGS